MLLLPVAVLRQISRMFGYMLTSRISFSREIIQTIGFVIYFIKQKVGFAFVFFLLLSTRVEADARLSTDTDVASAGYFVLDWSSNMSGPFLLQQSSSPDFFSVDSESSHTNRQTTITGLDDGTYFYRVRDATGLVSNVISVEVAHHSLTKAFSFFILGCFLFVVLLSVLLHAQRALNPEQRA